MEFRHTRLLVALGALQIAAGVAQATSYLYAADPFNVFVRDSFFDYNADTWGAVASGGTVSTSGGFAFGSHGALSPYTVIAAVDFTATGGGSLTGNLYDGHAGGINPSFTISGTVTNPPTASPIDFADQFAKLDGLSTLLSLMPTTTGDGCVNNYGTIKCTASASGVNVINIDAATVASANNGTANSYDIGNNYGIEIHITDPNATVVINVAGTGQRFTSGAGFSVIGGSASHVLFNYYEATSLTLGPSGITASLLAPLADVGKAAPGGNFDGTFIAKSFSAGSGSATEEFHSQSLFDGVLPQPQPPVSTPEPATFALLAGGFGLIWWRRRR